MAQKMIVGLDIGGSTTKVVAFRDNELLKTAFVKASDPVASAYGGFGSLLRLNQLKLQDISEIHITGVGSSYINGALFDLPTHRVDEFRCSGLGGVYEAEVDRAVVVSMGTGTSMVYVDKGQVEHIIGSGVGGGTLLGLGTTMLKLRDISTLTQMAESGDISRVDLCIGDISCLEIPGLDSDTTASNFGKIEDSARPEDMALGIVNLVFQSVGTAAVLAARLRKTNTIIFTGNGMRVKAGKKILQKFAQLYGVEIIVPRLAEYATAIGAAISSAS